MTEVVTAVLGLASLAVIGYLCERFGALYVIGALVVAAAVLPLL